MLMSSSSSTRPSVLRGRVKVNSPTVTVFASERGGDAVMEITSCIITSLVDVPNADFDGGCVCEIGTRGSADVGGGFCWSRFSSLSREVAVTSSTSAKWYFAHDSDVDGVGFFASRSSGFWILFSVDRIFSATAAEYALLEVASRFAPVSRRDGRGRRSRRSSCT
jgi:hypothetical protein